MIRPVPIRVIGTTGTLVFAAMLKAPFCTSPPREKIKVDTQFIEIKSLLHINRCSKIKDLKRIDHNLNMCNAPYLGEISIPVLSMSFPCEDGRNEEKRPQDHGK
jgi:hypothetical protein